MLWMDIKKEQRSLAVVGQKLLENKLAFIDFHYLNITN